MAFDKIARYIGFGAPFVAASLIYALFKFLDKKASGAANRTITAWIKGEHYKQLDLKAAVIEGFDHLYGKPLFRLRSFLRSAGVSSLAVVAYLMFLAVYRLPPPTGLLDVISAFAVFAIPTILSDYASLFLVRSILQLSTPNLAVAILFALITVVCAIAVLTFMFIEWFANVGRIIVAMTGIQMSEIDLAHPKAAWLTYVMYFEDKDSIAIASSNLIAIINWQNINSWFCRMLQREQCYVDCT